MTQSMYFHRDYLDAVRTGRKTTTVRFRDPVATGPVDMIFELDEDLVLQGVVTQVVSKRVDELTDQDAVADGFRDLEELHDRLRYHYPDIAPTDEIAIVQFRLTDA
ncbi:ASCH domain-containing protein [Streptomyces griseosporeus]|uniref:ASCH domain-containing protein n=1 Tax=Streptomyces griseosporeus TaxID=1910 RepID=UPI0036D08359